MAVIHLHQNKINPLVLPVIIAQERGLFQKYQVEVDLRLANDFVFNMKQEFLDKKVDAVMGDTTFFFYYLKEGKKAMITSTLTRTIQLVGKKQWENVSHLRVGVNRTGLFRFFVDCYLQDTFSSVEYVWINNTYERMQKMSEGKIDALVAIEPFVSQVLKNQKDSTVIWHSQSIDACYVMWCFDQQFILNHPEDVRHFHQALEEAGQWFNSLTPEEKNIACQTYAGYSLEQAQDCQSFEFEQQKNYQISDYERCQEWMLKNNEIDNLLPASQGIFQTFE